MQAKPPKSTDPGYLPCSADDLFATLCVAHDTLDELGISFVIGGGTLLGAVREGNLIAGDSDWDLELIDTDLAAILGARGLFESRGLFLEYPLTRYVTSCADGSCSPHEIERRIVKVRDARGRFHGDFFLHTLFSDGILRRFNLEQGAYFNAKMSFPAWFIENRTRLRIRDREFHAPASPLMMVERIYGPLWRTPVRRHGRRVKGYNFSGAYKDAPIEPGLQYALEQGWVPRYPGRPHWPRKVRWIDTPTSARWIARHEHLEGLSERMLQPGPSLDEANACRVAEAALQMHRLKEAEARLEEYERRLPLRWLNGAISWAISLLYSAWLLIDTWRRLRAAARAKGKLAAPQRDPD